MSDFLALRGEEPCAPDAGVEEFPLTAEDFRNIALRVKRIAGIVLADSKRSLVYGRLGKRLRQLEMRSFREYLEWLDGPEGGAEEVALVNAITTNLTSFFRENHHFETLARAVIPEIAAASARPRRLRVWSAGCSSGEEPYSIAMTLHRALPRLDQWDARILATDIDTNMIAAGRAGQYDAAKAEAIPADLARRYVTDLGGGLVEMDDSLRRLIQFNPLNLLDAWPMRGPFDAIFCRNVVIYFGKDTQRILFDRFAELLKPEGWLFMGHSESLFRVSDRFRHAGRTIYRKIR